MLHGSYGIRIEGLKLALQLGFQRVVVQTDRLQVLQLWNKLGDLATIIDPVLREISDLRIVFQEFLISFVSKNFNKVAYFLAKQVSASHVLETRHVTSACVYHLIVFEASASL